MKQAVTISSYPAYVKTKDGDLYKVSYHRDDKLADKVRNRGAKKARFQAKRALIERLTVESILTDSEKLTQSEAKKFERKVTMASRVQCIEQPRIKRRKKRRR